MQPNYCGKNFLLTPLHLNRIGGILILPMTRIGLWVPLYMNYQWCSQEMHTFTHPLSPLGKGLFVENLNTTALDRFPNVLSILNEFIDTKLVNYIGVSLLPPNTILHPHKHSNPGNLKLHSCVLSPSCCGLSYSDDSQTYQHDWSRQSHRCILTITSSTLLGITPLLIDIS